MADAQQVPSFKLVLVGDGGTGKVRRQLCASYALRGILARAALML